MTTYSGYTTATPKSLLLDAGAFFKNFIVGTDTFATAVAAGKLLGATSGGGTFSAVPTIRKIEIDGIKGAAKGLESIDEWVVTLTANIKEITKEVIQASLAATTTDTATNATYDIISADNYLVLTDYIDNITWVGKLSGSNEPAIIQVYNALSTGGLTLQTADKAEATLPVTFTGHYDDVNLDNPPFKIYYPKAIVNSAVVDSATFTKAVPADKTFTITTSGSAVCGGVRLGTYTLAASQFTLGSGTVLIKKEYLGTLTNGAQVFTLLMDKGNNITAPTVTVGA
jgi:hypothetical protein